MTFWSTPELEPKRQFKFLLVLPGEPAIETYLIKSVNKPQVTISTGATVNYIQHSFKYPGRLTWNDISVTLLDTIREDDTSSKLANIVRNSGYIVPTTEDDAKFSFTKRDAVFSLGKPRIQQIDAGNALENIAPKVIEEWTLWNAWVNRVDFGGQLDYSSDAIVSVTLGITYDWAEYVTSPDGSLVADGSGFQPRSRR